jgi:predicted dehydrogenase
MDYQRDATDRVRVALVGVGMHAYRNLLPVLTFLPVELVAVADIDIALAERTARQYGVHAYASATEMYAAESLDAVLLCVSPGAHPHLAIEAFHAGLHVWMEKPAAATVGDVDRMLASQGDRIAVVGYKKAFMPATDKVLELTTQDEISTIQATYPMAVPSAEASNDPQQQAAAALWLANGCHPLSFLVRVAGPVASVTVHRGRDSSGVLVLRHHNGALSNLHLALGAPFSQPFERYTVHGRDTTVMVENSRRVTWQRGVPMSPHTSTFAPAGSATGAVVWEAQDSLSTFECRAEVTQGLHGGLAHFVECVRSGNTPVTADLAFAHHLAQLSAAAIASAGDTIELGEEL